MEANTQWGLSENVDMAIYSNEINRVDYHVGRMIILHRKAAGLTRAGLSVRLEISPRTLTQFEQGRLRVSPKLLSKICVNLNVTPNVMFATMGVVACEKRSFRFRNEYAAI